MMMHLLVHISTEYNLINLESIDIQILPMGTCITCTRATWAGVLHV